MNMNSRILTLLSVFTSIITVAGQSCQTVTLAPNVPAQLTSGVALRSYSYCNGQLEAIAYVANLNYDKLINLWYYKTGIHSLTAVPLDYIGNVTEGSLWEYWGILGSVPIDGITSLSYITYTAISLNKTFTQPLNVTIKPPYLPTSSPIQQVAPRIMPKGLSKDITDALSTVQGSVAGNAFEKLLKNISPAIPGSRPGSVLTAQSGPDFPQTSPDYEINRVRDAAFAMDIVQTLYSATTKSKLKKKYEDLLFDYATGRATEQTYPALVSGLGEPAFYLNQTVVDTTLDKPQIDGTASTAIALMEFATEFLASGGNMSAVKQYIYDSTTFPSTAPVQKDLQYIAGEIAASSYDLWDEVPTINFYTRLVQRKAIIMGVDIANKMDDRILVSTLIAARDTINQNLGQFWDASRATLLYENGNVLNGKTSYLDMSVILGILHGYTGDDSYTYSSDEVLSSAYRIATSFISIYPINNRTLDSSGRPLGNAIGRYPEDTFNGVGPGVSNPWYFTTAAMAQYMYSLSKELNAADQIVVTDISKPFFNFFAPTAKLATGQTYVSTTKQFRQAINGINGWGDAYMRRLISAIPANGVISEAFDRVTGLPVGAPGFTWSYAALLSAAFARADTMGAKTYVTDLADEGFLPNVIPSRR